MTLDSLWNGGNWSLAGTSNKKCLFLLGPKQSLMMLHPCWAGSEAHHPIWPKITDVFSSDWGSQTLIADRDSLCNSSFDHHDLSCPCRCGFMDRTSDESNQWSRESQKAMILTTEQKRLYQELQETDTELFDLSPRDCMQLVKGLSRVGVRTPEQLREWFEALLEADDWVTSKEGSLDKHRMSSKPKLLTTSQALSFLIAFFVVISLWVNILLRWTREGVIALQPVTLSDYIITLGLFVVVPFIVISLFVALVALVALNKAKHI